MRNLSQSGTPSGLNFYPYAASTFEENFLYFRLSHSGDPMGVVAIFALLKERHWAGHDSNVHSDYSQHLTGREVAFR